MVRGSLLITLTAGLVSSTAFAAPEDPGPYSVANFDAGSPTIAGVSIPTKVYYPSNAPGPGPILVVMHGNGRVGEYHSVLARTLASNGFVVVLPDMPCQLGDCDHDANARQLSELLVWADAQANDAQSPIFGRSDGKRGLLGHSFGGLGAFLATAQDSTVNALVVLDPRDDFGAAGGETSRIHVPSAHLLAEVRGICNDDWGTAVYPDTAAPHLRLRVPGSAHCDVEDPTDSLCSFACGTGDAATTPTFRRYAVAFMSCVLRGDVSMTPYLDGPLMQEDVDVGTIDQVDHAGLETLACRTSSNAPPLIDGGTASRADGSPGASGDPKVAADAGVGVDPDEEGCTCSSGESSTVAPFYALLVLLTVVQRRRR